MAETDYQKDTIMKQTECHVSLQKATKGWQLEPRATPGVSPDAEDVDILTEDERVKKSCHWRSVRSDALNGDSMIEDETKSSINLGRYLDLGKERRAQRLLSSK